MQKGPIKKLIKDLKILSAWQSEEAKRYIIHISFKTFEATRVLCSLVTKEMQNYSFLHFLGVKHELV